MEQVVRNKSKDVNNNINMMTMVAIIMMDSDLCYI